MYTIRLDTLISEINNIRNLFFCKIKIHNLFFPYFLVIYECIVYCGYLFDKEFLLLTYRMYPMGWDDLDTLCIIFYVHHFDECFRRVAFYELVFKPWTELYKGVYIHIFCLCICLISFTGLRARLKGAIVLIWQNVPHSPHQMRHCDTLFIVVVFPLLVFCTAFIPPHCILSFPYGKAYNSTLYCIISPFCFLIMQSYFQTIKTMQACSNTKKYYWAYL